MAIPDDIKIGYFRIPTHAGEGVACIALRRPPKDKPDGSYVASFSFCSPLDRQRFDRKRAHATAVTRLTDEHRASHQRWSLVFGTPPQGFPNLRACFQFALELALIHRQPTGASFVPGWVERVRQNGNWGQVRFGMHDSHTTPGIDFPVVPDVVRQVRDSTFYFMVNAASASDESTLFGRFVRNKRERLTPFTSVLLKQPLSPVSEDMQRLINLINQLVSCMWVFSNLQNSEDVNTMAYSCLDAVENMLKTMSASGGTNA